MSGSIFSKVSLTVYGRKVINIIQAWNRNERGKCLLELKGLSKKKKRETKNMLKELTKLRSASVSSMCSMTWNSLKRDKMRKWKNEWSEFPVDWNAVAVRVSLYSPYMCRPSDSYNQKCHQVYGNLRSEDRLNAFRQFLCATGIFY